LTTAVRRWALYKAQQGAYLAELEQLHSSISLPSTIKMVWSLRSFGKLSAGLLFMWSFYYIGSQACKAEFTLESSRGRSKIPLAWLRPDLPSQLSLPTTNLQRQSLIQGMNENLITTVSYVTATARDTKPYDLWGNPLIPILEQQSPNKHYFFGQLLTDQKSFAGYSGPKIYSRNYFDTLGPFDSSGTNYDDTHQFLGYFSFDTSYTLVVCDTPQLRRFDQFPNGTLPGTETSINITRNDRAPDSAGKPTRPREVEVWERWNDDSIKTPGYSNGSVVSVCRLTQSFVNVGTLCSPSGCAARSVYYSPGHNGTEPSTPFDDDEFATDFFDNLLRSTGPPKINDTGTMIVPSSNTISKLLHMGVFADVYQLPDFQNSLPDGDTLTNHTTIMMNIIAMELTKMVNTYYTASQTVAKTCTIHAAGVNITAIENDDNPECFHITASGSLYDPQFKLSIPWVVMDFLSCLILFLAALFAWWLRRRTLAPDIFGFVSSLTRENPHFALDTGDGSHLSGLDRARLLGNVKVKIGDVAGHGETVGRIGLSQYVEGYEAGKLHKERKYA
jgi:hypothetical protein